MVSAILVNISSGDGIAGANDGPDLMSIGF